MALTHDDYPSGSRTFDGPAEEHYSITPSDDDDLPRLYRAIVCASAGDVAVRDRGGRDVTYTLAAGEILPFRPVRILDTGTTATLVGWM